MADHQLHLEKIKSFVTDFFRDHDNEVFVYHNVKHTEYVVDAAMRIANHYQLSDDDFFIVVAAAWFHDTGYLIDRTQHEEKSVETARGFLAGENLDAALMDKIAGCILATKMPQKPEGLLQQIICDADLFHLGTDDFKKKNKLMREEHNLLNPDHQVTKAEWRDKTVKFFDGFEFHTDYARLLLTDKKNKNITELKEKVYNDESAPVDEHDEIVSASLGVHVPNADGDKKAKKGPKKPDKGIETMFRISSNNHSRLSDMADNKAHILITVNSILLSAVISLVLRKIETSAFLTLPAFILLTVSLITIIVSILATRPHIPQGVFSQADVDKKTINLLFFGNFYKMSLEDYTDAMVKVMSDSEFLYDNLIRDVYFQGVVLGKKYRLLRIAYNIFMVGLSISVVAFIVATARANGH